MIKIPYKILIFIGVLVEIMYLLFEKKVAYGPIIFWFIAAIVILDYSRIMLTLSNSVKRTKPEIFKKFSFGILLTKHALSDDKLLDTLNENEKLLLLESKIIFRYFFICFVLFGVFAVLSVLLV